MQRRNPNRRRGRYAAFSVTSLVLLSLLSSTPSLVRVPKVQAREEEEDSLDARNLIISNERVDICHNGKTTNVKRSNLPKRKEAGDKIGKCGRADKVPICHITPLGIKKTLMRGQAGGWRHMLEHPNDSYGPCGRIGGLLSGRERRFGNRSSNNLKVKGQDFEVSSDLNNPSLLKAVLQTRYDHKSKKNRAEVNFYGTRQNEDFYVQLVDLVTLQRGDSIFVTKIDPIGRPTLFRNTRDSFEMSIDYVSRNVAEFTLEMNGKTYTAVIYLNDVFIEDYDEDIGEVGNGRDRGGSWRRRARERKEDRQSRLDPQRQTELQRNQKGQIKNKEVVASSSGLRRNRHQEERRLKQTSRRVSLQLSGCSEVPYNDAIVQMDYEVRDGSRRRKGSVTGVSLGRGQYEFFVPVDDEDDSELLQESCIPAVYAIEKTCLTFDDTLFIKKERNREALCEAIIDYLDFDYDDSREGDEANFLLRACMNSLDAAYHSCAVVEPTSNSKNNNWGDEDDDEELNIGKEICEKGLVNEQGGNSNFIGEEWELAPRIVYPYAFADKISVESKYGDVPGERFDYQFSTVDLGEKPTIISFIASPTRPHAGEGYRLTARVSCVDASRGDEVQLTYVGSDDFKSTSVCEIDDRTRAQTCTFRIAGAPSGVEDKCEVSIKRVGAKSVTRSLKVLHGR